MPVRILAAAAVCFAAFFATAEAAEESLGLVTGLKTGTYYAFGKDIAGLAARNNIAVDVKPSEGSIDNIKRINSRENAALGIVQSDVLGFLARSKNPDSMRMATNLRMIFPFYNEEVHILARKDIKDFSDLKDKRVAIGEEGSGNMLTAINLFAMMDVTPAETKRIPSSEGLVAVLNGQLDAVVFVAGKPVRLFKNLEDLGKPENKKYSPLLQQVHFLALDNPKMLEEYKPAVITHADYDFVKEDVKTIAVQAVMVSYDFSQGAKKRCAILSALAKAMRGGMEELRKDGHPKWKEVDLDANPGLWQKDACAWADAKTAASLEEDLINVIGNK